MARRLVSIAVAIFGIFFITSLAWAVAGTLSVNVMDQDRKPIPNARVELTSVKDPTKTQVVSTDDKGQATIEDEDGEYWVHVVTDRHEQKQQRVTVRSGETTSLDFTLPRIRPYASRFPGDLGRVSFSAGYSGAWQSLELTSGTSRDEINGFVFEDFDNPDEVNRESQFEFTMNSGIFGINVGGPTFTLLNTEVRTTFNVGGGVNHVEVEQDFNDPFENDEKFKGTGGVLGTGFNFLVQPENTDWYGEGGMKYWVLPGGIGTDRSPSDPNLLVDESSVHAHSIMGYAMVGYTLSEWVGVSAGINVTSQEVTVKTTTIEEIFMGVNQVSTTEREFGGTSVSGIVKGDLYFGQGFFGGVKTVFNTNGIYVSAELSIAIGSWVPSGDSDH